MLKYIAAATIAFVGLVSISTSASAQLYPSTSSIQGCAFWEGPFRQRNGFKIIRLAPHQGSLGSFDNKISSLRCDVGCNAVLYEFGAYQGASKRFFGGKGRLRDFGWSDRASSIKISCGRG